MDRWKFYSVTRKYHAIDNPLREAKLDQVIEALHLAPDALVLDIACGDAEMLCRIAERYQARCTGVEISPFRTAAAGDKIAARGLQGRVIVHSIPGKEFTAPDASFDAVSCFGATWIWNGLRGTLEALARWTRTGGIVAVGEPHWLTKPPAEYLKEEGWTRDLFSSHAGNIATGESLGLVPLFSVASNTDDFDRYEGLTWLAAADYARDNPDDPDVPEVLADIARARRLYLTWGRDTLSWAVYLFRKP